MSDKLLELTQPNSIIVGTGLIALDLILSGEESHPPQARAGGTCGNVLTAMGYLGWQAYPISRLSSDAAAERIRRDLSRWNVHLDFAGLAPTGRTPVIVQQIYRDAKGHIAHRFSWHCPACGARLPNYKAVTAAAAQEILPFLPPHQVFFLDRVSRGALTLASESAKNGALIVFEPSAIGEPKLFQEALALTHILKYSRERLPQLADADIPEAVLLQIETLGTDGLRYRFNEAGKQSRVWQHSESYPVPDIKDTAGAGDWCTAGLIQSLGRNGSAGLQQATHGEVREALSLGQALAAWNCRFEGARGGMYLMDRRSSMEAVKRIIAGNQFTQQELSDSESDRVEALAAVCAACADAQPSPMQ